jgi:A/G-specific adenine glycosylase
MPRTEAPPVVSSAWKRSLAKRLLTWFGEYARDLPWRRTSDLYCIWISEIMLQQTQVATVIPYYERFLAAFPTAQTLAGADEQAVLRLWEGLGYYRRARQLHAAAKQIVAHHGGKFPQTFEEVRALPGIGRYTAGAILSIGLGQKLPILEANTIRVFSRLAAFRGAATSTAGQKFLWSLAEAILPEQDIGHFNQALMELGSEICFPREPACLVCPVNTLCAAKKLGLTDRIPTAAPRTRYEEVTEIAVVVRSRENVLLRQCQPSERWAGLWDFPRFVADETQPLHQHVHQLVGIRIGEAKPLVTLKHGVTRFRITLNVFEAQPSARRAPQAKDDCRWAAIGDLEQHPLSVTGRKIARLLQTRV